MRKALFDARMKVGQEVQKFIPRKVKEVIYTASKKTRIAKEAVQTGIAKMYIPSAMEMIKSPDLDIVEITKKENRSKVLKARSLEVFTLYLERISEQLRIQELTNQTQEGSSTATYSSSHIKEIRQQTEELQDKNPSDKVMFLGLTSGGEESMIREDSTYEPGSTEAFIQKSLSGIDLPKSAAQSMIGYELSDAGISYKKAGVVLVASEALTGVTISSNPHETRNFNVYVVLKED